MDSRLQLTNYGLAIGIPLSGRPTMPEWGISLAVQSWPINTALNWLTVRGREVAEARTIIVKNAKERGVKYLWFIDEDVAVPHFAISKLMFELRQRQIADPQIKIIGGIYCTKSDPAEPIVFKENLSGAFWEWTIGDVFECSHIGGGCMLIDMSVFDAIPQPWFETVDKVYDDTLMFRNMDDHTPTILKDQGNEDSYFTMKVRQHGFKILAHGGVLCPHWNPKTGVAYVLPVNSHPVTSVPKSVLDHAQEELEVLEEKFA